MIPPNNTQEELKKYTIDQIIPGYQYSTTEAGKFLRYDRKQVLAMKDAGKLGYIKPPKPGGNYRFLGRHLIKHIHDREVEATAYRKAA